MSKKPEALRIAERCESLASIADAYSEEAYLEAAAELRRLHALNVELLGALRALVQLEEDGDTEYEIAIPHWEQARAVIARTKEQA